ncbi:MAG: hypothetical protein OEU60_06905 [Gammaproteobacteria bacterium]|nr:hypothetical protein [Gammaproteobacteria bacterium]
MNDRTMQRDFPCSVMLAAAIATIAWLSVAQSNSVVVGRFEAIKGDVTCLAFEDKDNPRPVKLFTEVLEGDVIVVGDCGTTATIRFLDGTAEKLDRVSARYGPYQPTQRKEQTVVHNLWTALSDTVGELYTRKVATVATASRGDHDTIIFPDLAARSSPVLVEGQRSILIRWWGGRSPYTVRIKNVETGDTVAEENDIRSTEFRTGNVRFTPGLYAVEVADASAQADFDLQVAESDAAPSPVVDPGAGPQAASLLSAYSLAIADDNLWAYEAYQRLAVSADSGYEPAALLLQDLEDGGARYWRPAETNRTSRGQPLVITAEQFEQAMAADIDDEEFLRGGVIRGAPAIVVDEPDPEDAVSTPFTLRIRFIPNDDAEIVLETLKIKYAIFDVTGDVLDRMEVTPAGVVGQIDAVKPGTYKFKVSIADDKKRTGKALLRFRIAPSD